MADNIQKVIITADNDTKAAFAAFRKDVTDADKSVLSLEKSTALLKTGMSALGVSLSFAFLGDLVKQAAQFETALVGVSKTTGLAGHDLDQFAKRIDAISRSAPVSTQELLDLAQAAGQMGVSGSENLEKFSLTVAKLGRASDLAGEEAAKSLARILNVTGESVGQVDTLASVIVSLGNNFAASESEIARMTTEVARATGVFGTSSAEAAAMGTTMAALGIQAEVGGSAVGRSMMAIGNAVTAGGKSLNDFASALDLNAQTLQELFAQDRTKAFEYFLQQVGELGIGAGVALKQVGLGGQEIAKTIIPLAGNTELFARSMNLANAEVRDATALDREYGATLDTLNSKWDVATNNVKSYAKSIGEFLAPAVSRILDLFNSFSSTAASGPADLLSKNIADMQERLESLRTREKFLGPVSFLGVSTKEIHLLEDQIQNATADLAKLVSEMQSTEKSAGKLKTAVEGLSGGEGDSKGGMGGLASKTGKARDRVKEFVEAIQKQASEAGKTAVQIKRMEAAQLGVLDAVEPYLRIIEDQAIAEEDLRISRQKQTDDLRRIEQLTNSVRTKQEVYNDTVKELDDLLAKGLGMDAYTRALKDAQDQLAKTESSSLNRARDFWDTNEQIWISGIRNTQSALANGLFDAFDGNLKGMVSSVKRAVGQMIAEFASIKILQSTGIAGILGMGSTAAMASGGSGGGLSAMNMASLGSGAMNLMSSGFGMTPMIGNAALQLGQMTGITSLTNFGAGAINPALASFVTEGAGGLAASAGSTFGSFAGPALAAAAADMVLRQLFGDKKLGGTAGDVLGYVPVVGTLINGLFGRGAPKFQGESLVGNVSAGGFEGVLNQVYREKGGLARSDRVSNFIVDSDSGNLLNQFGRLSESGNIPGSLRNSVTDPAVKRALEVGELLDEAFGAIGNTLQQTADKLGISSDALSSFSAELDLVSAKGEALSESQISDEITRISDAMIATLIPNLDDLAKKGETSADTLGRLNSQFSVLESAAMLFGNTAEQAAEKVRALGLDGQTAFIESLGGVQVAASEIQEFYDTVFTDAQKLDVTKNRILDVLKPLGVDFVPTLEQLYDAVASGNPQLIQAVLKVDGLVSEFDRLNTSLTDVVDPIKEIASTAEELSGEMRALAAERRAFTVGRREAQEGLGGRGEVATTINGRIYTETEIRAMQQSSVDLAAESASALIKEQLARAGSDSELIKNLNATLEFIKFQSGERNVIETASRLNDDELAKQAAAQLKALNAASRTQRGTTFNGSVRFPDPPGWNESADNAEKQRMSYFDVIKSQMAEPAIAVGTAFNDLRSAALKLADDLLLGDKSILSVFQKTGEAQRQYDDMISRARLGDATSSELSSGVNNLLDAQLNSASTKFEFDRQFATVVNDLRSIGETKEDKRLAEQAKSMAELREEVRKMRADLNAANNAIAKSTAKTADVLDRWSVVGLPATET